jgi:NAD-dependent DNA ligase
MTPNEAQHKIQALSTELEQHNYNYYVLDNPTISDYEFDKLLEELMALEKQFPEFLSRELSKPTCGRTNYQELSKRETSICDVILE